MAKGNDGNYLQHSVEVEIAAYLTKVGSNGRLHIALTHGMGPFECFERPFDKPTRQERSLLKRALAAARRPPKSDESPVVTAYRETGACEEQYPNSAELLRSVVGTELLSGGITETNSARREELRHHWCGSRIETARSSWRSEVGPGGILSAPDDLRTPWLFSMDPMTYIENGRDEKCLHPADIDHLSGVLSRYVRSGQPGVATLFVYAVPRETCRQFWNFVNELADRIEVDTHSYWVLHEQRTRKRNLAGLLYTGITFPTDLQLPDIEAGRPCSGFRPTSPHSQFRWAATG